MGDNSQKGLGSDNMDPEVKEEIQRMGGEASKGGGRQSNDQSNQGQKGGQTSGRGFAANPDLASEASQKAHEEGNAHEWNSDEASDAGEIGGSR